MADVSYITDENGEVYLVLTDDNGTSTELYQPAQDVADTETALPDPGVESFAVVYNVDGSVQYLVESIPGEGARASAYEYNLDGTVATATITSAAVTRTETYVYDLDGRVESMTASEVYNA